VSHRFKKGFTLIELLIVVGLLIIIAVAFILIINPVEILKRTRDDRRISEITELNKAVASSIVDNTIMFPNAFYEGNSCTTADRDVDGSGWAGGWGGTLEPYLHSLPVDPINTSDVCYYFGMSSIGTWEINAVLESRQNIDVVVNDNGNAGDFDTCANVVMPDSLCRYEVGTDLELI
jgi:hypothetical protein